MIRQCRTWLGRILAGTLTVAVLAAGGPGPVLSGATVQDIRVSENEERTRVVFDLDARADHEVFSLSDPERVVIDFTRAALGGSPPSGDGVIDAVRSGTRNQGDLRIVLDLSESVRMRSFAVGPGGDRGHRLVVDLQYQQTRRAREPVRSVEERGVDEVVVAIDAGHGGVDPGAIGPQGTFEKDVALAVSRKLEALLHEDERLTPVMIRDGDYYMGLRDRTRRAHDKNADLFLSLHADAIAGNRNVRGASVYALSQDGASSEAARLLARRENAADFIGGVSLRDKDDAVASVLVDLSRAHTIESSLDMGEQLLDELGGTAQLHRDRVEQAGFAVLKSLDMPSLLIELGFMTNPEDERRLNDDDYQNQLAGAIASGVRDYAEKRLLPELREAEGAEEHVVERGDTLSAIARQYRVSVSNLRAANDLSDDQLSVGSRLVIP